MPFFSHIVKEILSRSCSAVVYVLNISNSLIFYQLGGRDRQGRSILTIPAGKTEDLSVDQLGDTLVYLTQIPRYLLLLSLPINTSTILNRFSKICY